MVCRLKITDDYTSLTESSTRVNRAVKNVLCLESQASFGRCGPMTDCISTLNHLLTLRVTFEKAEYWITLFTEDVNFDRNMKDSAYVIHDARSLA